MTKYLEGKFQSPANNKAYTDNYDKVFKKAKKPPNPGSQEAQDLGCTCPVMDNSYGKGARGDGKTFWQTVGCLVHCP